MANSERHKRSLKEMKRKNTIKLIIYSIAFILFLYLFKVVFAKFAASSLIKSVDESIETKQYPFTKHGVLNITADGIHLADFDIEIAETPEKQEIGLMYRKKMAPNQGMLFVYDQPQPLSFWMKNTYLPLDMIFIDEQNKIAQISKDTVPYSEDPIICYKPVLYVLEVNAGICDMAGITVGSVVSWERIKDAEEKEIHE
ncbi:MAG: DUF192 domain-containing protein [Candidatus Cloacimonetes bacterium]|nr:DUF192 domain-containing protein [Candidatus Cloacimonadota bacterium]